MEDERSFLSNNCVSVPLAALNYVTGGCCHPSNECRAAGPVLHTDVNLVRAITPTQFINRVT